MYIHYKYKQLMSICLSVVCPLFTVKMRKIDEQKKKKYFLICCGECFKMPTFFGPKNFLFRKFSDTAQNRSKIFNTENLLNHETCTVGPAGKVSGNEWRNNFNKKNHYLGRHPEPPDVHFFGAFEFFTLFFAFYPVFCLALLFSCMPFAKWGDFIVF
jgi:hypothetical protein